MLPENSIRFRFGRALMLRFRTLVPRKAGHMILGTGRAEAVFSAWEDLGIAKGLRKWAEHALPYGSANLQNLLDRRRAAREAAAGFTGLHSRFAAAHGYPLSLDNPQTFSEKIQWRKLNDRNPLLPVFADKLLAKSWVEDRLGEDLSVPTLFAIKDPRHLPEDIADQDVLLKVTHASARNLFVKLGGGITRNEIIRRISRDYYRDYGTLIHEWAYSQVDRSIIAEPVLRKLDGSLPDDLKLHMMDGELKLVQFNKSGLDAATLRQKIESTAYISKDWTLLPVTRAGGEISELPSRPRQLDRILQIANSLSRGIDYLRVDFFLCDDDFYVSEMSFYTSSGFKPFSPSSFDRELGQSWTLPN